MRAVDCNGRIMNSDRTRHMSDEMNLSHECAKSFYRKGICFVLLRKQEPRAICGSGGVCSSGFLLSQEYGKSVTLAAFAADFYNRADIAKTGFLCGIANTA